MRPPIVHFSAAYVTGLWAGLVLFPPPWWIACTAGAALAAASRRSWVTVLLAACAVGTTVGSQAAARRSRSCVATWTAGQHSAILRIHDAPGARGIAMATVLHAAERCAGDLRLRLDSGSLQSGATFIAVGSYRPTGILRVRWARPIAHQPSLRFRIRDLVGRRIHALYGDRAPLVEAIVLGRRGDLDPDLRSLFVASGLAHILAISGLHVGMIAGWILMLAGVLGERRRAWLWGAGATWIYVFLLGFPPPATRAAAFVAINAVAWFRERRPPPETVLAVAGLVIVTIEPEAVTALGAWLSAAAVWGTATVRRYVPKRGTHATLYRLIAASLGATVATAPITAFGFGSVAPIGVLANLIAVPLAAIAVPGVFASLLVGGILASGAGVFLTALEAVAAVAAAVPGGHLQGDPGLGFAAPWIVLFVAAAWTFRTRPTWLVARRRLLVWGAGASWFFLVLPTITRPAEGSGVTIHVLDVGQGDAIAIRTPRGRWVLIDAGPRWGNHDAGRRVVLPFFRRRGVERLDVLIISHGDADHLGGAPAVVEALRPGLVLEPGQALGSSLYLEFLGAVDAAGSGWDAARAGDTVMIDSIKLVIAHPSAEWMKERLEPNENSIVVRLIYRAFDAVFTGDIGLPAESVLIHEMSRIELLKVGHHGSSGSTGEEWLNALDPAAAVVSVGRENRYGHPAPAVVRRLHSRDVKVYRTDVGGTVTIRSDGRYFEIVQGGSPNLFVRIRCLLRKSSISSGSSWRGSGCIPKQRESSRTFFTTSP